MIQTVPQCFDANESLEKQSTYMPPSEGIWRQPVEATRTAATVDCAIKTTPLRTQDACHWSQERRNRGTEACWLLLDDPEDRSNDMGPSRPHNSPSALQL